MEYSQVLDNLRNTGNFRSCPSDRLNSGVIDLSSNDYLGLSRYSLADFAETEPQLLHLPMSSVASRLLAACQEPYSLLENDLAEIFRRPALIFNSGYHANTGIVSALADRDTIIIADRLVHASIIDGIILSRSKFQRFAHNNFDELERLVAEASAEKRKLIIVESRYSMDGDSADIERLINIKKTYENILLYVDEAHSFGAEGAGGQGVTMGSSDPDAVDVIIGTFGKALASYGAFAAVSPVIKDFLINRARSFIFSTAISPLQVEWSRIMIGKMKEMDDERLHLQKISRRLYEILSSHSSTPPAAISHIQALIVGDAARAVEISLRLRESGIVALPIRTPTVPAGTERIRFSLSTANSLADLELLNEALNKILN
ncbi:MAG: aminotransferase class I/II-fold pyridoxal phosphate-dependent enzyme [Muribaculaceae bacterium]